MRRGIVVLIWAMAAVLLAVAAWQVVRREVQSRKGAVGLTDIDFPSWSPDGTQIVFSAHTAGGYDLWVVDAVAGASPRRLTTSAVDEVSPAWGPDGRIAYAADPGAAMTRWMAQPRGAAPDASIQTVLQDGSDPIQLTHHQEQGTIPAWDEDGNGVRFWCAPEETPALCRVATDFSGYRQIGEAPDLEARREPASPDGRLRAVIVDGPAGQGLYLVPDGEPVSEGDPLVVSGAG